MPRKPRDRKTPQRPEERAAAIARRKRVVHGVAVAIGVGIALVGAGLLAIAVVELLAGRSGNRPSDAPPGMLVILAAMIWWGLQIAWPELGPRPLARRLLAWRTARRDAISSPASAVPPEQDERERRILALAEREQGRLTVLETAARCDLTADDAKALLDGLVLKQVAQLQVSEAGVLVYVFPGLLPGRGR